MNYITSWEYGRQPFTPDPSRGHWATVSDYFFVSIGMAFRLDFTSLAWIFSYEKASGILPHLFSLAVFVVPLMVIQSFLGQFSSSGYISALRVSPFFKGIGYISLLLNFCVLTYYSIFAATPLFYFLHSLRPTLPWSCEGMAEWSQNLNATENANICNQTAVKNIKQNVTEDYDYDYYVDEFIYLKVPSVMFYRQQFNIEHFMNVHMESQSISWQLVGCTVLVWAAIASIFHTCRRAEKLGHILHLLTWVTLSLLVVCVLRFLYLPNTSATLRNFFHFNLPSIMQVLHVTPLNALQIFGPGWGAMLSLASFNKFKTDIGRQCWLIAVVQMFILFAFLLIIDLIEGHLHDTFLDDQSFAAMETMWGLFLASGSALASISLPNLWSLVFFGMMTLSSVIVMVIQAHSFFTAIFDEFVFLRQRKTEVIFGLIGTWCILSFYSCTVHGISFYLAMVFDAMVTQIAFDLLILLIVLWIYGRVRFQRDIQFMLGYTFPTWKVYVMRFVAPLALLGAMCSVLQYSISSHMHFTNAMVNLICLVCLSLAWLIVPIHIGYIIMQTTGPIYTRWKKVCLPTDWCPVAREDRQRYEEAYGNDTNRDKQQLDEIAESSLLP